MSWILWCVACELHSSHTTSAFAKNVNQCGRGLIPSMKAQHEGSSMARSPGFASHARGLHLGLGCQQWKVLNINFRKIPGFYLFIIIKRALRALVSKKCLGTQYRWGKGTVMIQYLCFWKFMWISLQYVPVSLKSVELSCIWLAKAETWCVLSHWVIHFR